MGYGAGQPVVWPAPPEWSNPVVESLEFLTDVMQASGTGVQQVRSLRLAPRRSFSFSTRDYADEIPIVDALLFDLGNSAFQLPIFPDVQWLAAELPAASSAIPCATAGYDFVAGGQAVLWRDATAWEVVTVDSIAAEQIALSAPTVDAWGRGDRLYPLRRARLTQAPRRSWSSPEIASSDVAITLDEPCDFPAAWPTATVYRTLPVLEWRGDETDDPTDEYDRLDGSLDEDLGPVAYYDLPGVPFRTQAQMFKLHHRSELDRFRGLAYALGGRAAQLWVPSWTNDLRLVQPAAANATQLQFGPCYYSLFGAQQANRRDLRIELYDGTVFYRRVTGSAQQPTGETLQLDSALGRAVAPADVRQICWLSVCQSASDSLSITHDTPIDAVASAQVNWEAVVANV